MSLLRPILVGVFYLVAAAEDLQRPFIIYENIQKNHRSQIQKKENEALRLHCYADYPIKWVLPDNSMYSEYNNPHYRLENEENSSTLVVSRLRYTDTGFYRCVSANFNEKLKINKEPARTENRVYVYVSDSNEKHLLLHLKRDTIILDDDEVSYINCLTTDVTAIVELRVHHDSKRMNLYYEEGMGFQIQSGQLKNFCLAGNDGKYCMVQCHAKTLDGRSDNLTIILIGDHDISTLPNNIEDTFYLKNNVTLVCGTKRNNFACKWFDPKKRSSDQIRSNPFTLSIFDVDWDDEGVYECNCIDTKSGRPISRQKHVFVRDFQRKMQLPPLEPTITLINGPIDKSEEMDEFGTTRFVVKVRLFVPEHLRRPSDRLTVQWYRQYSTVRSGEIGNEITADETFALTNSSNNDHYLENNEIFVATLSLKNIARNYSGQYVATICLFDSILNVTFSLTIKADPKAKIIVTDTENPLNALNSRYLEKGQNYSVWCTAFGFPTVFPTILFNPCVGAESNDHCEWKELAINISDQNIAEIMFRNGTFEKAVVLYTVATESRRYKCLISPTSTDGPTIEYVVTDINDAQNSEGFNIEVSNLDELIYHMSESTVTVHEQINVEGTMVNKFISQKSDLIFTVYEHTPRLEFACKTQKYDYRPITWHYTSSDGSESQPDSFVKTVSNFSIQYTLMLKNIQQSDAGIYSCRSRNLFGGENFPERYIHLNVTPTIFINFGNRTSPKESNFTYANPDSIVCDVQGDPKPIIKWYKDGIPYPEFIKDPEHKRITLENDNKQLKINTILPEHGGVYLCTASNYFNETNFEFVRKVVGTPSSILPVAFAVASGLLGIFVIVIVVVVSKIVSDKKIKDLEKFHRDLMASADMPSCIDEDVVVNEQASFLPYKRCFELPPKFIPPKDAPLLGKGAFGIVVKSDITIPPEQHIVAVKIIRNTYTMKEIHAIFNEVKVMANVENHVNVLSLVGAVSSHLFRLSHKLYIFTEFCSNGSLEQLLRRCRASDSFVDEVPRRPLIQQSNGPDETLVRYPGYIQAHFRKNDDSSSNGLLQIKAPMQNLHPNTSNYLIPRSHAERHRIHCPSGLAPPNNELCTSDLLVFSYQIANGMEFLFSKKIIHRDLAARNILVTSQNILRISDFGLAQQTEVYKIKSANRILPLRSLPLEVFVHNRFSLLSDVWSYGIVVWEMWTLGKVPYAEHNIDNVIEFQQKIRNGIRPSPMPAYAPDSIKSLMELCWKADIKCRPNYETSKKVILEEMTKLCATCSSDVKKLLNDKKNTPNFQDLREKLMRIQKTSNDGYEIPNSVKKSQNRRFRSVKFTKIRKDDTVEVHLL